MKSLVNFLFEDSAHFSLKAGYEGKGLNAHDKTKYEHLWNLIESAPVLKINFTPLKKALKSLGITGKIDDEKSWMLIADESDYEKVRTALGSPDGLHKLAELGWVATYSGNIDSDSKSYRVNFLPFDTAETSNSTTDDLEKEIAKSIKTGFSSNNGFTKDTPKTSKKVKESADNLLSEAPEDELLAKIRVVAEAIGAGDTKAAHKMESLMKDAREIGIIDLAFETEIEYKLKGKHRES